MYERILVPTDGSQSAEAAARHGAVIAEAFDASIHVISVVTKRGRRVRFTQAQAETAVSTVADFLEQESGRSCQPVTERGRPYETILEYSSANDIDLIVMGTHGRRRLRRAFLGSVTERVLKLANAPVLAVPPRAGARAVKGYDTVLIPTDGSPAGTAAVDHGVAIAERVDASVRVLFVIEGERGLPSLDDPLREEAVETLDAVAERAAGRDVPLSTHTQPGAPHEVISNFVSSSGIDLVAMGARGRAGIHRTLLGRVTSRVLRTCDAPVLAVRGETN